jgi:YVTN family beta-propeller protein
MVSVLNAFTGQNVADITVGDGPEVAAATPDGSRVFVTDNGAATVSVISTSSNKVTATIPVGSGPRGVVFSPDGTSAYVSNNVSNTVSVIKVATNAVVATIPCASPDLMAMLPNGSALYVGSDSNAMTVINPHTNTVTTTIDLGATTNLGVAAAPNSANVYVTSADNHAHQHDAALEAINTATNTVSATVDLAPAVLPYGVTATTDGLELFVAGYTSNTVSVLTTSPLSLAATLTGFANPSAVIAAPYTVYVSDFSSGIVSALATVNNLVFYDYTGLSSPAVPAEVLKS